MVDAQVVTGNKVGDGRFAQVVRNALNCMVEKTTVEGPTARGERGGQLVTIHHQTLEERGHAVERPLDVAYGAAGVPAFKFADKTLDSENVFDNKFPIWATEHMYCAKDADEATTAFLDFMLSDDVQKELVEQQGFIPVSEMKVVKDASGKVTEK